MYKTKYLEKQSLLNVYKNGKIIFSTEYIFPDSFWWDFEYLDMEYSLQACVLEDGTLWIGMWNNSKVMGDYREDNVLKSSVTLMKLQQMDKNLIL